ncbi:hypothetical protein R0381_001772 [Jeongeupia wiesaeckerbachi]|uniref:hypothetical protein n=1 Tax=Jeongeupia wiesaeckerbachi TaxID=3051218 RepID=UPI003D806FCB
MFIQKIDMNAYAHVMATGREEQERTLDAGIQTIHSIEYAGQHIVIVGPLPGADYALISESLCVPAIFMNC